MSVVIQQQNYHELQKARRERTQDEAFRTAMGLRYVGLCYIGGWHKEPKAIYKDADGNRYFKKGPAVYELANG